MVNVAAVVLKVSLGLALLGAVDRAYDGHQDHDRTDDVVQELFHRFGGSELKARTSTAVAFSASVAVAIVMGLVVAPSAVAMVLLPSRLWFGQQLATGLPLQSGREQPAWHRGAVRRFRGRSTEMGRPAGWS